MYTRSYEVFVKELEALNQINHSLLMYTNADMRELVLAQSLVRDIKPRRSVEFFAIRQVKFREEDRGKGRFKSLLNILESKSYPVMIADIVNDKLNRHLDNRGWVPFINYKNNHMIKYRYHMNGIEV